MWDPQHFTALQTFTACYGDITNKQKQNPWPESASELNRPNERRLSAKLVPTFADRGCRVVSVTDHYGRILGFLDRVTGIALLFFTFTFNKSCI
jgi:hypothetical protein